jgi:pimeloyl-ACP methyl ester carboxylesterase
VLSNYAFDKLVADAIEIVAAAGYEGRRFHLVGHDWGGQVSWGVAHAHPKRLASLTVLSRPHPLSFRRALQNPDGDQKHRSRHHGKFLDADTGRLLLEDNARRLRESLFGQDVALGAIADHVSILGNPAAIEAALAWYRANKGLAGDFGTIAVPTLYIWGDKDATVGPDAAHGTGEFIGAAYAMEVLPGVGHFVMDQAATTATELMLAHMKKHPV